MSLQVELLEESFEKIKPQANEFVDSFYKNLFKATPEVKPLFAHTDMEVQQQKLLASLILVIENIKTPDVINDSLKGLGARHVQYGALPKHYPLVGAALLTTFEQYLKNDWTPDVKKAWIDGYDVIAEIMLDGADYSPEEISLPASTLNSQSQKKDSKQGLFVFLGGGTIGIILLLLLL